MLGFNGGRLGSKNVIEQNGIVEPSPDANFDDVTLLLNGNGSNGSTDITDSSDSSQTITLSGNTQISTAQSKFGGSSIYFDGNGDFLQPPNDSNSFSFGTGNFTLECWIYPTGQGITTSGNLFSQRSGSNNGITWRYVVSSEEMQFFYSEGFSIFNSGTDSVPLNTWTHVALTRSGNTFTLWVGGQSGGTNTITASMAYTRPRIGTAVSQPNEYYKGYIDDFRITKGVARYTASFTPPTSQFEPPIRGFKASGVWTIPEVSRLRRTFVWPPDTGIATSGLLLNLDAGDTNSYPGSGTTWTDLSGNGNNGTLQGGASYVSGNGGAISFDGSNDRVVIPNDTALDTQTPSVEVWVKVDTISQDGFFFEKGDVNTQYALFIQNSFESTPQIKWRVKPAGFNDISATAATYVNTSSYAQVVGTYTSGSRKLYINGSLVASDSATGTIPSNSGGMSVGAYGGFNSPYGYYFDGEISIVRVYNRVLTAAEVTQNFNVLKGRYGL